MKYSEQSLLKAIACLGLIAFTYINWQTHQLSKPQTSACSNQKSSDVPKQKKSPHSLGTCEKCNKALRKVNGKFGEFIGCSGYPDCKYIQRERASFCCPQCTGAVEKRVWSEGILWGCSNYPNCRYGIFSDISDNPCTACQASPYQIKTVDESGNITLTCPNRECPSKQPSSEIMTKQEPL